MNFILGIMLVAKGIIGTLDWKEITDFPVESPEYQNSLAVGRIQNGNQEICNGTHVGNNEVLTANHCCVSPVTFNKLTCLVDARDVGKDICSLRCALPKDFPSVVIGEDVTTKMYILHLQCDWRVNPYCKDTMKYSPGEMKTKVYLSYTADTLPGTSGAAIFNDKNEMIGVHHTYSEQNELNYGSKIK